MTRTAIALVAWAVCGGATAADMSVYGFEIGKPLELPDCAPGVIVVSQTCQQVYSRTPDGRAYEAGVLFPLLNAPSNTKGPLGVIVAGGAGLQAVIATTYGARVQPFVMRDLVAKYGEPTERRTEPLTNAYGAKIDGIVAIWDAPDLRVEYIGVLADLNTGSLVIGTPAGVRAHHEIERARAEKVRGRPL